MAVSFPMQTAEGEIIFVVGEDFTLTADQILELLEREELHAEGVRRLVAAQTEKPLGNEGGGQPRSVGESEWVWSSERAAASSRLNAGKPNSPVAFVGPVKSDR
jgi:hypothetical protein